MYLKVYQLQVSPTECVLVFIFSSNKQHYNITSSLTDMYSIYSEEEVRFFRADVLPACGRKVNCCFIWETLLPIFRALCHLMCSNSDISFGDKNNVIDEVKR
jgi:hypothetical protein